MASNHEADYCIGSNEGQLIYIVHKIPVTKHESIKNSSKSAHKGAK